MKAEHTKKSKTYRSVSCRINMFEAWPKHDVAGLGLWMLHLAREKHMPFFIALGFLQANAVMKKKKNVLMATNSCV